MARRRRPTPASAAPAEASSLFEPYVWAWFEKTFGAPSPPQTAAWPAIARGQNTLIFSPTGSGKTLAAFLWCINELFRTGSRGELDDRIYVLYVSPLKALNNDIQKNLVEPLRGIQRAAAKAGVDVPEVRSAVRTGDTSPRDRQAMSRRPPHIFITTPESLFIILSTQKFREAFRTVRYVIVDEIHAMSDNKRGVHLSLSLERLEALCGRPFVRIGLSATQKPLDAIASFLVGAGDDGQPRPCQIVDIGARKNLDVRVISPVDNLLEAHFDAIWGSAYAHLIDHVHAHDTTLVFTNSRYKTERTALRLNELSAEDPVAVGAHHGSMSKQVRLDMENRLKKGGLDALVATSSLELGIDVGSIDLVCQIESPKSVSKGMQRIGRAGHLLDATSKGRLLVTDRDDLVESAVLVKAILDGEIDTTRIPHNCLDVLAQHIVGAVAADDWRGDDLYQLCRRSHCYRDLSREQFDRVLDMLAGNYTLDMERPPFPTLHWDKINDVLAPERGSRMIAFRASGTIPDVADYDVWLEERRTKVGRLDEGFVEDLRTGDIFILGSSAWRVLGIRRNRVLVEDVYGKAPTIPHWSGDRDSRTADLGVLVGRFRRTMAARLGQPDVVDWLQREYCVDPNGARSIHEYFREQRLVTGDVPSDELVVVEHFRDELGQRQIVIHSCFGIRVNDTWAMALCQAIEEQRGFRPPSATVDDGILLTVPKGKRLPLGGKSGSALLGLVTPANLDALMGRAVATSPVFASRFRHNAVRALLVLREYQGRRTPVWLQSLRASELLEACRDVPGFPLIAETLRECLHESLDVASLRRVLRGLKSRRIRARTLGTKVPSPFTHSLLLLGQYGEMGSIPTRERRSRLVHLHRELLRQILDEETLRDLLDRAAVERVEARLQHTDPQRRARDPNEMARMLQVLGDLVDVPDDEMSLLDRTEGDPQPLLARLVAARRAVCVPIPTAETNRERWIATDSFPLYRAAFAIDAPLDDTDRKLLRALSRKAPRPLAALRLAGDLEPHVDKLVSAYRVLRLPREGKALYVAASAWVPQKLLDRAMPREEARLALVESFLRSHGPVTKYEVMERYGFADRFVDQALAALNERGIIASGEYVPTKSFPQWCTKGTLEEIHRLTLNRLRREMEPATPEEYADFLLRWQHVHPATRLKGVDGLREVLAQLQGHENFQAIFERDVFPSRVGNYDPSMLDRLCYGGEVFWRRFEHRGLRRGQIGFCLRGDQPWLVADPNAVEMELSQWDDDIPEACGAVRQFLAGHGACFFDDIVAGTGLDWRLVLRAVWHLVWTGEATNDSYESIRHASFTSGLSGAYDLFTLPRRGNVGLDYIVKHMLEYRKLDPRLGRWAPTERLVPAALQPPEPDRRAWAWARLLLSRWGVVCRDSLRREIGAPPWRDVRRALARLELLGKVRRGFFVQDLAGEQYAYPEAVDALRDAKLRATDAEGQEAGGPPADEPMVLLDSCDPASVFTSLFPTTNETGEEVKFSRNPHKYMVLQAGRPLLLYHGSATLLADLPRRRAEGAVRALMRIVDCPAKVETYKEIHVRDWNGHPIEVSPARHLLARLGFVQARSKAKGWVYDGAHAPDDDTIAQAEEHMPAVLERAGKEKAPVTYDAEWIISRSPAPLQPRVRELLECLERILPDGLEFTYHPRHVVIRYRGVGAIHPHVGQKTMRLSMSHQNWAAWVPGIPIEPDTDLASPEFAATVLASLERTRRGIDRRLDRARGTRRS